MTKVKHPDTLLSYIKGLEQRIATLEGQARLQAARISSGKLNVGPVGSGPQVQLNSTSPRQLPGIATPGSQLVLGTGSATEAQPGAISAGSSGGVADQGLTVVSSPIFAPTSGAQVGASNYGTLSLSSSAKDSSANAEATLAAIGGYPNGSAASSATCRMDGSILLNGFPVEVLGDVKADGGVVAVAQSFARGAAPAGQGAMYGWNPTIHGNGATLPASTRPMWVDQQGATQDLTRVAGSWAPELSGFQTWTGDPQVCSQAGTGVSGKINLTALWVPGPMTVNSIAMFLTAVGATLTAGQCFAGLYDAVGNRVGVTADQAATWASAATLGPWAASFTAVNLPAPDWYYLAWVFNGTTSPSWSTHGQTTTNGITATNIGFPAGKGRAMKTVASTFTSLPATLPAFTSGNWSLSSLPWWTGLS